MSTEQDDINDKDSLVTYIKCEDNTDDDIEYDKSTELNDNQDFYTSILSTSSNTVNPLLASAYKGKIEVTSKGRRKIFDGVRWQILCKRPDCRKQTNKKSLCITHYKEEYESNTQSSWTTPNISSFQFSSYQQKHSYDNTKNRIENEDQNNTISTTNMSDNDEHVLLNSKRKQSIDEGQIEHTSDGRRFIFKNSKWIPLCKYDTYCHNTAKYDSLCVKHFELAQQKRRETLILHNNDYRHLRPFILSNDNTKRLKANNDFPINSPSLTAQFNIDAHENNNNTSKQVDSNSSSVTSKHVDQNRTISQKRNLNTLSPEKLLFEKRKPTVQNQSIQTDLTIPICCIVHQEGHSFHSSCQNNKSISSSLVYETKSEPNCFDRNFST